MSERGVHRALVVLVGAYVAYFGTYTCLLHQTFNTLAYDLGTVDQGVWLAGHSRDLFVTVRGLHLLGDHVRPFSFVLAPLYWIWDDVRMLLIAQTVAIAAGAVFVALLARRELGDRHLVVVALAASYLLNPAVQNLNLDQVHPDAFASTWILASIYFLGTGRLVPFWIAAGLAMSCKEDVPFVYVVLGLVLIVRGRRALGVCLVAVAAAYFTACVRVILPHFNEVGLFRLEHGYFTGVKMNLRDPAWFVYRLATPEVLRYLLALCLPVAFAGLAAPAWFAPGLPALLGNIFSDVRYMRTVEYHYTTSIVPFLYVAAIHGIAKLPWIRRGDGSAERVAALALCGCALAANSMFSIVPLWHAGKVLELWRHEHDSVDVRAIAAALARIPKRAVVSADYTLVAQLTHRQRIYMFPNPFRTEHWAVANDEPHDAAAVEYIVVRDTVIRETGRQIIDSLLDLGLFVRDAGGAGVNLYRRVGTLEVSEKATCGDWNGDGQANTMDARLIGAAITASRACPLYVCDADGDGAVTLKDGLLLGRREAGDQAALRCPARP